MVSGSNKFSDIKQKHKETWDCFDFPQLALNDMWLLSCVRYFYMLWGSLTRQKINVWIWLNAISFQVLSKFVWGFVVLNGTKEPTHSETELSPLVDDVGRWYTAGREWWDVQVRCDALWWHHHSHHPIPAQPGWVGSSPWRRAVYFL